MTSEERKDVNRQRIIEVSTKLFILQGIPMTTIAQIARESGVVYRTVLNIFGTKNNLVLEDMAFISSKILDHLRKVISAPEYQALSGMEQIFRVLNIRGEVLRRRPDILLLVSEVKVWVARSYHDQQVVNVYMDNVESLYQIMGASLEKGFGDGSINPAVVKEQALSILVPSFRAVIQQLAQVKINPEFNKDVDVDEQLEIQLSIIRAGLASHKSPGSDDKKAGGQPK
ncbi:MAG: TetR/AcrR family transcriptional regulator [Oscillibacter sp.]|jgi:AcrR family transcriptional regulator|nr:TetR/AcrR family transcriptional regulator [Oscillibacter sp.]